MAAVKKRGWGGPRKGAGRKPSTGAGLRRNRVVVALTDPEMTELQKLAATRDLPIGTAAYEILSRALKRRR